MKEEFFESNKIFCTPKDYELFVKHSEKFANYRALMLEWNKKINLTAITSEKDIDVKHFIDSLTILKYLNNCKTLIDVGTGAGFPGIPIAIIKSDIKITLLDSLNKRINFLNEVISYLDLKNVNTIHGRAEEFGRNKLYREKYDVAVSRAVANMTTLSEYLLPFVKVGGICICMKGSNINEELENAKFAINELGGKIEKVDNFYLPNTDIERNIVIIRKIKETSNKFPRKAGTPSKEPLHK